MEYPFVKCLKPKRIVNPYTYEMLTVPCGHCEACRISKSLRMAFQCDLECSASAATLFVTLTYDEDSLPRFDFVKVPDGDCDDFGSVRYQMVDCSTGEIFDELPVYRKTIDNYKVKTERESGFGYLRKEDIQKFMKRLRFYVSKITSSKIRYYAVGEYGPVHFRPHYHLLLFLPEQGLSSSVSEAVFASWKFGRIDVQVATGKASSYVASYVNGGCNLPSFLEGSELKPFCLHSWRLGQGFLAQARATVYDCTPDSFIRRSILLNGKFKQFDIWRSCYSYFFPRCKSYASKSAQLRTYSYRLYETARVLFPAEESCIDLARITAFMVHTDLRLLDLERKPKLREYLDYFRSSAGYSDSLRVNTSSFDRFVYRIYLELSVSRHFLTYVCDGYGKATTFEINRKVRLIDEFYKRLDYLRLTDFYKSQSLYMASDFCCDDDVLFFYDNVRFDFVAFSSMPIYKIYSSDVHRRFSDSIKHKNLNDINRLLFPDERRAIV